MSLHNFVTKEPSLIVIYQGNSSLSNCRVCSGEANFTFRKFKDDGELRADNTGHDTCLRYGENYMEKKWDDSTVACELLLLGRK
jgi:hypothetical protein